TQPGRSEAIKYSSLRIILSLVSPRPFGCPVEMDQLLVLRGQGRRYGESLFISPLLCTFTGTTCPTPMSVEHADIRVKSYTLNSRERYVCNSGFRRKAGTSSLTECVLNKTTNTAHWTTPSLKCIRDPSLTHQRPVPVPHSTVVTARVTPQPESPSPSGKEPAVLSPKSDTTVAIETAMVPGSQSMPSQPTSSGTTSIGSHESSQAPSQTTAKTLELTPSNSHETPVILSTSVTLSVVFVNHRTRFFLPKRKELHQNDSGMPSQRRIPFSAIDFHAEPLLYQPKGASEWSRTKPVLESLRVT
uniref:Interleukin-15 receptor subunit alpha n=1 Tax=Spermophilus dauricus TaxID=99837 RepID=A0A8C9P5A6_SPEDA